MAASPGLRRLVDETAQAALKNFAEKKLQSNQLAITLIDLGDSNHLAQASFRGDVPFYPASVIKLFYLVAAHRWAEDGRLQETEELQRAMRDMIVDSCNEATHYVVDSLTGTTSGPELSSAEMKDWSYKRNAVNRYFVSAGFTNINVNQKPWNEGPYGRERIFVGRKYENRNALSTEATARLLTEIALGRSVSPDRSAAMLKLLERAPFKEKNADEQAVKYSAGGLPRGARLWSKAGWTDAVRHDAALIELPGGRRIVLVTFTSGHSGEQAIIPFIVKRIVEGLP